MPQMATTMTTDSAATRRFAVACGVLSQYVKAGAPAPSGAATALMGAVQEPSPPVDGARQLTIFYGGRVVVLDGCTPARAAELIRYAAAVSASASASAAKGKGAPEPSLVDMPIARKASLQRFLAKRKDRAAAVADGPPYGSVEAEAPPPPAKKGKAGGSSWLALGSLGDMHAQ